MSDSKKEGFVLAAGAEDPEAPGVLTVVAYRPGDLDLFDARFPGQEPQIFNPNVLSEGAQAQVDELLGDDLLNGGRYGLIVARFHRHGGWDPASVRAFEVMPEARTES